MEDTFGQKPQASGCGPGSPGSQNSERVKQLQPTGNPKNPYGLGDPEDRSLRKVEIEVLIPKKMREKARTEKCRLEEMQFTTCCKKAGVLMVVKCRGENAEMRTCLERWYNDEEFKKLCKEEYLKERAEYRSTGLSQKAQRYLA